MGHAIGVLIKMLAEFLGVLLTDAAGGIKTVHEGLDAALEDLYLGTLEFIYKDTPLTCLAGDCVDGSFSAALLIGGVVFVVSAAFERFRWASAFGFGLAAGFAVLVLARAIFWFG